MSLGNYECARHIASIRSAIYMSYTWGLTMMAMWYGDQTAPGLTPFGFGFFLLAKNSLRTKYKHIHQQCVGPSSPPIQMFPTSQMEVVSSTVV